MKKITLIFLLCFVAFQNIGAQNKKIYVSKQGGKPQTLRFFKMGYYSAYYSNSSSQCDTLICRGSGLELCVVDKYVFGSKNMDVTKYYDRFNAAIRKTEKHIKKTKTKEGIFTYGNGAQQVNIKYFNADKKGNADIEIELL
jgi:hypothetical protein